MKSKKLFANMIASIFSFIVNLGISFLVTPFIVEKLGEEAYGFTLLANNFVTYGSIVTIALNSMAGRFISIAIHRKDEKSAETYYSSVFVANMVISLVLAIVSLFIVIRLKSLINVSDTLYRDVQITFALAFINFLISVISAVFTVATFVTNTLHLSSIRNIISNVIRVVIIIPMFAFLSPRIFYISIAAIASTVFIAISNYYLSNRLLPNLKIKFSKFSFKAIKEIISAGIWNSVNSLSTMLLTGLDLLIANLFISPAAMGILSVAKTVPTSILSFLGTIGNIFTPQFTILYAKNDIKGLVKEVKFSIKFFSFLMTVPLAGFIIFGTEFFTLWLPSKTASEILEIQILSVLTIGPNLVSSYIFSLYSINSVTNKLKVPVLLTLGLSVLSTGIVFILLKTTSLGVYAIAGVSSTILILRILIFVPTYAAHNLKVKLTTFYKPLFLALGTFALLLGVFYGVNKFVTINSWLSLAIVAIAVGALGYCISFACILNREEKSKVKNMLLSKIKRGKVIKA